MALDGTKILADGSVLPDSTDYYYDRKQVPSYVAVPPFPLEVLLDVTSFCNHACTFCVNPDISLKTTVSKDLALRFMYEAYALGARRLGVFGTGESFIYKHLHQYIRYAKEVGFTYVYIKTNGALCTPERIGPVLDAGLDSLRFSIHAGTREAYRQIQGKDDFDKVMDNLRQAHLYRKEKNLNVEIAVSLVLTDIGGNALELLQQQAGEWVDVWDVHDLNSQCGNLLENREKGTLVPGGPRYDFKKGMCKQPFSSLSLTPEGYISACIMDFNGDLIVGNYQEADLKSIWESDVYVKFRQDHLQNTLKSHICYSCIYGQENTHRPLREEYSRKHREQHRNTSAR